MSRRPPPQYRAPLRKRREIASFLLQAGMGRSYGDHPLFVWNIKVHHLNLDYDHLWQIWEASGEVSPQSLLRQPAGQALARERYEKLVRQDYGYDLCSEALDETRGEVFRHDDWHTLPTGEPCKVTWEYEGRQSGYLVLSAWEGYRFRDYAWFDCLTLQGKRHEWEQMFVSAENDGGMSYPELRRLYRFVVRLEHDLKPAPCRARVEFNAAFLFFTSHCKHLKKELKRRQLKRHRRLTNAGLAGATAAMRTIGGTHAR